MSQTVQQRELSYYMAVLPFRSGRHTFQKEAVLNQWRALQSVGVHWVGFDGINLLEPMDTPLPEVIACVGEQLPAHGLRISSLHYAGPTCNPLKESQAPVRAHLENYVETFASWAPRALVVHAGWTMGVSTCAQAIAFYRADLAAHGKDAIVEAVAGNLKVMARAAARHGILIAIENLDRFLPLGDWESLSALVAAVDEPNFGYCLDSGHAHAVGTSVPDCVRHCGARLFETHFHDNRARGKGLTGDFVPSTGIDEHLPVGFGTISWLDVIQALDQTGFAGPITFETTGWPDDDMTRSYRQAIAWWRACERLASSK